MSLLSTLRKRLNVDAIDDKLLSLYKNPDSTSINEFSQDCVHIHTLRKMLKKIINGQKIPYIYIRNRYRILYNIFGIEGIIFMCVEYFSENEYVFEYYCSLVYFFNDLKISNRMSKNFLEWLEKNEKQFKTDD